jgi:TnpA family transposase
VYRGLVGCSQTVGIKIRLEYDNIIKSLYFLEYINSLLLSLNVQRSLNRWKSYHKLRRAVSYANFGKLRFKTEQDQHIWNECNRLFTTYTIYYNVGISFDLLMKSKDTGIRNENITVQFTSCI